MRPSPQRHTLAVLRTLIGFTQKELAQILECSTATIQAVELGKLKLSLDLAQRVHFQTGVSTEWLLADDVNQPPVTGQGKPYTKAYFEKMQTALISPKPTGVDALAELWRTWSMYIKHVRVLSILYAEAYKRGKVPHVFYKAMMATKEQFVKIVGEDSVVAERLRQLAVTDIGPINLLVLTETLGQFEAETGKEFKAKLKHTKEPIPRFIRNLLSEQESRWNRAAKEK